MIAGTEINEAILNHIIDNPKRTCNQIADALDISVQQAKSTLGRLLYHEQIVKAGHSERQSKGPPQVVYAVKKPMVMPALVANPSSEWGYTYATKPAVITDRGHQDQAKQSAFIRSLNDTPTPQLNPNY